MLTPNTDIEAQPPTAASPPPQSNLLWFLTHSNVQPWLVGLILAFIEIITRYVGSSR